MKSRQIYEAFYLDGRDPGALGDIKFLGDPVVGSRSDEGGETTDHGATEDDFVLEAGEDTGFGWPAAVPVRADNWDLELSPARYTIASGDTLSGLAQTYAGDPQKWRNIYDMNKPSPISNPDVIFPGQVIKMPKEMSDNFIAFLNLGEPEGVLPGELSKAEKAKGLSFFQRHKTKLLIGGLGLAGAGGAYLIAKG